MPVGTSQDVLYLVLSIAIVWVTVFLCWLLYQAARVLHNANKIMDSLVQKLEYISDVVTFMKDKVEHVSKHMGTMSGLLSGVVEKFVVSKLTSKLSGKLEENLEEKKRAKASARRK